MVTAFDIVEQAFNVGHCLHLPVFVQFVDLLRCCICTNCRTSAIPRGFPVGNPAVFDNEDFVAIATAENRWRY